MTTPESRLRVANRSQVLDLLGRSAPVSRAELAQRQYDAGSQEDLARALAESFAAKPLAAWLQLFDAEDVAIGGRVEMTFRRLFTAGGVHNYFWKARPLRGR